MNIPSKIELLEHLNLALNADIQELETELESLQQSIENESKSSAGDKYETGREMINQEIGKVQSNLNLKRKMIIDLQRIDSKLKYDDVQHGALIVSADNIYFISIPIGRIVVNNQTVYCVSPTSPIVQEMLGKKLNEEFILNGQKNRIDDLI